MGFDFVSAVSILTGIASLFIFLIPIYGLIEVYGIESSRKNVSADSLNSRRSYAAFYRYKDVVPFSMSINHQKPQVHIPIQRTKLHYDFDFSSKPKPSFPLKSTSILTAPHNWGNDTFKDKNNASYFKPLDISTEKN